MTDDSMQTLVSIKQQNIALLFSNYLLTIAIQSKVVETENGFEVSCQADKLSEARTIFAEFVKNPYDKKYQQAAWQQGEIHPLTDKSPTLLVQFGRQFIGHAGPVTLTVFALCWLVFVLSLLGWASDIYYGIRFFTELNPQALFAQPWRLIGPALFHFSWLHIAFNTMWWWQLGGEIEKTIGKGALINLFLISAIASNIGQFMVSGPGFGGLSGVVYALVGFVWWLGWLAPHSGLRLSKPLLGMLLFWMLLGFANILPINMANTAHLLGLVSGCVLAVLYATLFVRRGVDQ